MLAAVGVARSAAAQRPDTVPKARVDTSAAARRVRADSVRSARFCRGQVVTRIDVDAQDPTFPRLFRIIPILKDIESLPHTTTRENAVRSFLAVREGQPCTELRRAESERILRIQPFIATAQVLAYPDTGGGVRLLVRTRDELSNVVGLAFKGARPTVVQFGDGNVDGRGVYALGSWRHDPAYRDGYGAKVTGYQIFNRPYQIGGEFLRRPVGDRRTVEFAHPFFTDLQRVAWRARGGAVDEQFDFTRQNLPASSLLFSRRYWDVGGVVRLGAPGRLSLFGASLTRESDYTDDRPMRYPSSGAVPDTAAQLFNRYARTSNARVNALWGVRNIEFLRVESFEALNAEQDVRTGFQFGTLFGRSLSVIGSSDDDIFTAADIYTGLGSPRSFMTVQAEGEGRQDGDTERWDAILASGRAAWYLRPASHHTIITTAEYASGWRQRVPFQLTFHDRDGGLRGYRNSQAAGAERVVGRVEDRWRLGVFRSLDFGVSGFVDAGKLWAGDAPFGVTTPVRVGTGIGVLASPRNSQKLYRLEIGFPVSGDPDARFELRVRTTDANSVIFWSPPNDIRRSQASTQPTSVFTWP